MYYVIDLDFNTIKLITKSSNEAGNYINNYSSFNLLVLDDIQKVENLLYTNLIEGLGIKRKWNQRNKLNDFIVDLKRLYKII